MEGDVVTSEKSPDTPEQHHEQEEQNPKQSSWGSWFSSSVSDYRKAVASTINEYVPPSITSSVSSTITEYIKPAVSSIGETASTLVKDIQSNFDALQEDEPQGFPRPEVKDESEIADQQTNSDQEESDRVESLIEAGVSTFSTAAGFFGSVIQEGIKKVQGTNIDQVKTAALEVASLSLETTKKATNTVVEQVHEHKIYEKTVEVGHSLGNKTFDALEAVGKKALDMFLQAEAPYREQANAESQPESEPESPIDLNKNLATEDKVNVEPPKETAPEQPFDFTAYFEHRSGPASLQALSKLSEESSVKIQQFMKKLPVTERLRMDEIFNKVQEYFDAEEISVEVETQNVSPGQKSTEQKEKHDLIISKAKEQIERSTSLLSEELRSSNEEKSADVGLTYLDLILNEGSKRMVELTVSSIEQLLSVAEDFLQQPNDQSKSPQNPENSLEESENFPKIVHIVKLANSLDSDISQFSTSIIGSLRNVVSVVKSVFESGDVSAIDSKANTHVNTLYLDTTAALSHVQDSKKHLVAVCQSLILPTL